MSMTDFKDKVTFHKVIALQETRDALLCKIDNREVWLPKSQIHDDSEVYKNGTDGDLVISKWIATEKSLV